MAIFDGCQKLHILFIPPIGGRQIPDFLSFFPSIPKDNPEGSTTPA